MKGMILDSTKEIYQSLNIKELNVCNLGGSSNQSKPDEKLMLPIAMGMAMLNGAGSASVEKTVELPKEKATPSTRHRYKYHHLAENLKDVNEFFKPSTNSSLSRNLT